MVPKRPLRERIRAWRRSLQDPLRGGTAAARWVALAAHRRSAAAAARGARPDRVVSGRAPAHRTGAGGGVAARRRALRADHRPAHRPVLGQLPAFEQRRDPPLARRVRSGQGFHRRLPGHAQGRLRGRRAEALEDRAAACARRLAHYKAIDGKFRLFRYGHWIPAQWRELHELYEFARMRGWQREPLAFGAGAFSQPGRSLEQEYIQSLLLMRLDSGNFTPDQVEWVARSLEEWTPSLTLMPPPGTGAISTSICRARRASSARTSRAPAAA